MAFETFIRGIVKSNPTLKDKLQKADSKDSPFQYVYKMLTMTIFILITALVFVYLISKKDMFFFGIGSLICLFLSPLLFKIMISIVDVQIVKLGRELDGDLLFASEYLLVALESGLPIGNAIENLGHVKRPSGRFFKRIYIEFQTGKSMDKALSDGIHFSASKNMKNLVKKLQDSINIGSNIRDVLVNFVDDSTSKKMIEAKAYSKKLNPIVMMYLLMGIVLPSLGITFLMLGMAVMSDGVGTALLKWVLIVIFLVMFGFQYFAYSIFRFKKSTI